MGPMFNEARRAFCAEAEEGADSLVHGPRLTRPELQRFAHRLRGSAGLFGANRTAFLAGLIEKAARLNETDDAELDDLIEEFVLHIRADCIMLRATPP